MPDVFATQKNIDASIYVPVNDVLHVGGVWQSGYVRRSKREVRAIR